MTERLRPVEKKGEGASTMQAGTAYAAGEKVAMIMAVYDWCKVEWLEKGLRITYGYGDVP